jgi:hypothetical protein
LPISEVAAEVATPNVDFWNVMSQVFEKQLYVTFAEVAIFTKNNMATAGNKFIFSFPLNVNN